MKKILIFVLTAVLALGLVACGPPSEPIDSGDSAKTTAAPAQDQTEPVTEVPDQTEAQDQTEVAETTEPQEPVAEIDHTEATIFDIGANETRVADLKAFHALIDDAVYISKIKVLDNGIKATEQIKGTLSHEPMDPARFPDLDAKANEAYLVFLKDGENGTFDFASSPENSCVLLHDNMSDVFEALNDYLHR